MTLFTRMLFRQPKTAALAHDTYFRQLADKEFSRLKKGGHVYLDYTGGGLHAQSQLQAHYQRLSENVFGNPHSSNPTSSHATRLVEQARQKVLDFFNAEDYYCIFTPNASGALKIIGESFPWAEGSRFLPLADNHNSVNGIREFCRKAGGTTSYAPILANDLTIDEAAMTELLAAPATDSPRLFALPAQSNVSGVKHDQAWIARAKAAGWSTLLDAAAFVPTNRLDLKAVQPDFVSLSFYKIFGFPTGIGCLLVRKDQFDLLQKPWFAGGTVRLVANASHHHRLHHNHECYEDGTINYLDIPAITDGLTFMESIGMDRLSERVASLTSHLCKKLRSLRHANGQPLLEIYGPDDRSNCGGNLIFNVLTADGRRIPFAEVEAAANKQNISLRSGCFCNPGIDEVNNDLSSKAIADYFATESNGNYYEMMDKLGRMRGAVRVSVGVATLREDLEVLVDFLGGFA